MKRALALLSLALTLAPAAALAQADPRCRANADCAATFAPYAALFDAQWDMERYRAFLARYDEKSPERRYYASGAAPAAPKTETEWYDKWAWRLPHNQKPWSLDYQSFKGELDGYLAGFELAQKKFAELSSAGTAKELERGMRASLRGAFPGDMDRTKLSALDVIYVYLGEGRRDFLSRRLAALKKHEAAPAAPAGSGDTAFVALKAAAAAVSSEAPAVPVAVHKAVPAAAASSAAVASTAAASVPLKTAPAKPQAPVDLSARDGARYAIPTLKLLAMWAALPKGGKDSGALQAVSKELVLRWAADEMSPRRARWLAGLPQMKSFLASLPAAPKLERRGREAYGAQEPQTPEQPDAPASKPARDDAPKAKIQPKRRTGSLPSRKIVEPPAPADTKACAVPLQYKLFPYAYGKKSLADFFGN